MGYIPPFSKVAKLINIEKEIVEDTAGLLSESKENLFKLQEVIEDEEQGDFYADVNRGIEQGKRDTGRKSARAC